MSKKQSCKACYNEKNGVTTRRPVPHTCIQNDDMVKGEYGSVRGLSTDHLFIDDISSLTPIVLTCMYVVKLDNKQGEAVRVCTLSNRGEGEASLSRVVKAYQAYGSSNCLFELDVDGLKEQFIGSIVNFYPGHVKLIRWADRIVAPQSGDVEVILQEGRGGSKVEM